MPSPKVKRMRRKYIHKKNLEAGHPAAKLLQDQVLSPFVQWVLIESDGAGPPSTYLLLSDKSYRAACRKFASVTEGRHMSQADVDRLRQLQIFDTEAHERMVDLEISLKTLRDREAEVEKLFDRAESELRAAKQLKLDLLRLIEAAKLDDAAARLQNMFDLIDEKALKNSIPPWMRTRRKA